jgi:hypothetical protein
MNRKTLLTALVASGLLACSAQASIVTLAAIDDTTLLRNIGNAQGDANFGGRTNVVIGNNNDLSQFRYGIFRFDVTSIATQITAGTDIQSATLTLTELFASDATHANTTRGFSVHGITAANAGWVEGTANGTLQVGTASLSYLNTGANNAASTDWASGGASPTLADLFTFGTDTGAAIGTGSVTFATGSQQTLVINLDTTALKTLLAQWQTSNSGLAIQATGTSLGQTFWDSNETGVGQAPATLNITFVPEPSSLALLVLNGVFMWLVRGRNRN